MTILLDLLLERLELLSNGLLGLQRQVGLRVEEA